MERTYKNADLTRRLVIPTLLFQAPNQRINYYWKWGETSY